MNIAKIIDHTNINSNATAKDIKKTCQEAKEYGFRGVCINPRWTGMVKKELEGFDINTVVLIDPPMGLSSHQERKRLFRKVKKDGADEADVVMNVVDLKYGRHNQVLKDLTALCKILPTKVIIGSGFLTDKEIEDASRIVKKSGAICVKTATSGDPLGEGELKEKAKHLKIMAKAAPGLLIKASGSIKTKKALKAMVKAGADIVGTSSGVMIAKK